MTPSPWLATFLKTYEKFRPTAYAATGDERRRGIWTCGWGHTHGVTETTTCTMDQANAWLADDIAQRAVAIVNQHVTVPLTQNQFDALCSLVFNCGPDPLFYTLGSLLAAKDYKGAAAQFPRWDRQAGVELPGLEKRRDAEMAHFLT
jgi:lysozyme